MQNLASIYSVLGRHQDALVLREKTLERFRRVLPDCHPLIGLTRTRLLSRYSILLERELQ
jgi:hypothetical protein